MSELKLWLLVQDLLTDLHFSQNELAKVKSDLTILIKSKVISDLLAELSPGSIDLIRQSNQSKSPEQQQIVIISEIVKQIGETRFEQEKKLAEISILSEYLQHVFKSLKDENKRELVQKMIDQLLENKIK